MRKFVCAAILLYAAAAWGEKPKSAAELKKQGDALLADGKKDQALDAYVAAMNVDLTYTPAYDAAAPLWFAARQYETAVSWLEGAVERKPSYSLGWYNLAFAYRKLSRYEPAINAYQKFMELRPDEPDPYFGMAMTYKAMGENGKARDAFAAYVEKEKRPEKQKFVDQAKKEIAALGEAPATATAPKPDAAAPTAPAEAKPENMTKRDVAAAAKKQGDDLRAAGDLDGAAAKYREAIATDADFEPAHNELGTLLFQQKKTDEAIAEFETAVRLDGKDDVAWYNLAHARRKAGKHKEAVDAYRAYIALRPENPDPYYGLGHSLKALGDLAGAREAFSKYVALEKRPTEQKWVEKAKQEIAELDKSDAAKPATTDAAKPATTDAPKPDPDAPLPPNKTKPAVSDTANPDAPLPPDKKPAVPDTANPDSPLPPDKKPAGAKPAVSDTANPDSPLPPDGAKPAGTDTTNPDAPLPPGAETAPPKPPAQATAPTPPAAGDADGAKAYREQGDDAFGKKQYDNAANAYRNAAAADPADRESRYRLGVTLAATGDLPGAITAWESVLLIDPKNERARRNIELARLRLSKAKAQIEDDAAALTRVQTLVADGRFASALVVLDGYTKPDVTRLKNPDVLLLRAQARLGSGDAAGAAADYDAVVGLAPARAGAYRGLGDAELALGDTARARYYYQLYIVRADGDPDEQPHVAAVQHTLETLH